MNLPNLIISASLIFIYFFGTVSIASVPIAGHYRNVTRTPTEDAYLVFSVIGFFLEIGLTVYFVFAPTELNRILNILLMIKDGIFGISLAGIGISCAVLEGSQRSGIYGNVVGTSNIYSNYNYGAYAAAAFFAFLSVIAVAAHFVYTLLGVLQVNNVVQPLNSILNNLSTNQNNRLPQVPQQPRPNWQIPPPQRPRQTNPSSNIYRYDLPTTSPEFNRIKDYMINSIQNRPGKQYNSFEIVKIERLFNDVMRKRYEQRKLALEQTNNGDANECLLFHGSPSIENIIDTGFNINYANARGMFGKGIYFASNSSKSDQYTAGCQHRQPCKLCERYLLCCRVCLGKTKVEYTATNYNTAPVGFDSVSGLPGGGLNFPEYIVYRDDQAYAEYKITYKYT